MTLVQIASFVYRKAPRLGAGIFRVNARASDEERGVLFASRRKRAFCAASLVENLQNPVRMRVIAGSGRRVTTALRSVVTRARRSALPSCQADAWHDGCYYYITAAVGKRDAITRATSTCGQEPPLNRSTKRRRDRRQMAISRRHHRPRPFPPQ
jgi:hypothetical protein